MIKKNTLLIDGNAVAHTIKVIDSQIDSERAFVRAYLSRIREYAKQFPTNTKALLFFDCKADNWREKLFPDYQKLRKAGPKSETAKQEQKVMSEYITYLKSKIHASDRFEYISYPSTESDDLIALYCKKLQKDDELVTIITTDKDLYQLISENASKPVQVLQIIHRKLIKSESEGQKALERKVLLGDASDSIPGICKNVGEKSIDDFMVFLSKMKETNTDPTNMEQARRVCESVNLHYVPSYSNYSKEQHELNRKLINLDYVIELDEQEDNVKERYLESIIDSAIFSPRNLYSLTSLTG